LRSSLLHDEPLLGPIFESNGESMDTIKLLAIVLILGGALGLAYGGFTYTKDTHRVDVGPIHLNVEEKKHVSIPLWGGVSAIVLGGILLLSRNKK
jgi:hypothetical protein